MMMLLIGEVTLRIVFRVTVPKAVGGKNINFISGGKEMCHWRSTLHSLTNRYQCLFCGIMCAQVGSGLGISLFPLE